MAASDMTTLFNNYRSATAPETILLGQLRTVSAIVHSLYNVQRANVQPRFGKVLDHLTEEILRWRYIIGHAVPSALSVAALAQRHAAFAEAMRYAQPAAVAILDPIVPNTATAVISTTLSTRPAQESNVTFTQLTESQLALNAMSNFLQSDISRVPTSITSGSITRTIVIGIGAIISLIALIACVVVFYRDIVKTRRAMKLVHAFGDSESTRAFVLAARHSVDESPGAATTTDLGG